MTNINCFELFAGCGGLGYGFHKEGINIIACNELDSKIASTYKEKLSRYKCYCGRYYKTRN